jgi:hypothetical protein
MPASRASIVLRGDAGALLRLLQDAVEKRAAAGAKPRQVLHTLSAKERERFHQVLEVIMPPHQETPAPGSAHELICWHFFPGGDRVLMLGAWEERRYKSCTVETVGTDQPHVTTVDLIKV